MDMEERFRCQFRQNWSRLKNEPSARWKTIADASLEKNIIDFDDLESIKTLQIDSDRIEDILFKAVKLRKCTTLFEILKDKGFGNLCDDIRNTGVDIEEPEMNCSNMPDNSPKITHIDPSNKTLQDLKQYLQTRDNELNKTLKKRDAAFKEELDEHFRHFNEQLNAVSIDNKRTLELYDKCLHLEEKYRSLQSSYQQARDKINKLTTLAQEKNLSNSKLTENILILKEKLAELERDHILDQNHDTDKAMIEQHKEEMDELEKAYAERVQEVNDLTKKLEEQKALIETKERELSDVKGRFKLLQLERDNIRTERDHTEADKAENIMRRLEQMIREHDMITGGITGISTFQFGKGRGMYGNRR